MRLGENVFHSQHVIIFKVKNKICTLTFRQLVTEIYVDLIRITDVKCESTDCKINPGLPAGKTDPYTSHIYYLAGESNINQTVLFRRLYCFTF